MNTIHNLIVRASILIFILIINFTAYSQFKVKTVENDDYSTTIIATCNSIKSSYLGMSGAKATTIQIGKLNENPYLTILLEDLTYLKPENLNIRFTFYSSLGEEHIIYTTSVNYQEEGYHKYWFYLDTDKLIPYFKKYTSVKVYVGEYTYNFSLSGFTSSYNKILVNK